MWKNITINCGFYHKFNNDKEINELIDVMKKNPDAEFNFELNHLGNPSEHFNFSIHEVDDGDTGYYNYIAFTINEKEVLKWNLYDDTPWGAIWSTLYDVLVLLNRYAYAETP